MRKMLRITCCFFFFPNYFLLWLWSESMDAEAMGTGDGPFLKRERAGCPVVKTRHTSKSWWLVTVI